MNLREVRATLQSRPWLLAIGVMALVVLWFASGLLVPGEQEQGPAPVVAGDADAPVRVQVRPQVAEQISSEVRVYGRTAPARTVDIKAETSGRVAAIGLDRGRRGLRGNLLLQLDLRDRQARFEQAQAAVNEQQSAYAAQLELKPRGYVSDTQLASTLASLEAARAELVRAQLDLERMQIRAPFDGLLLDRTVEVGDFVREGDTVATFVDTSRIIVSGSVAEQDASRIRAGEDATVRLVTGQEARGKIRYIAPVAEQSTRTFTVEVEVANRDGRLPAGVTAEMRIPAGESLAHRVSPALLSLDASGKLGIKTVDATGHVEFHEVAIVRSESNGVWVTGLPASASVIVVGQGYVSARQPVVAVEAQPETALAAGDPASTP